MTASQWLDLQYSKKHLTLPVTVCIEGNDQPGPDPASEASWVWEAGELDSLWMWDLLLCSLAVRLGAPLKPDPSLLPAGSVCPLLAPCELILYLIQTFHSFIHPSFKWEVLAPNWAAQAHLSLGLWYHERSCLFMSRVCRTSCSLMKINCD